LAPLRAIANHLSAQAVFPVPPDVPDNQPQVQADVEQQGGYLDNGMNQDLIIGSDWYDYEDLDGSGEEQGEAAGEDGAVEALEFTAPEAFNT
jgi:hypothetical protein